ncbi:MAG: YicC family protein [Verrucomicrobiaceae bacterium]|nr:YicC family protein [Verrucomicrobiaceae bacterium]
MTGFGRGEATSGGLGCTVEVSSVNRKQLEVVVNLPRELSDVENELRADVMKVVSRGRVTVAIKLDGGTTVSSSLRLDLALADEYLKAARELEARTGLLNDLTLSTALRWPGVAELQRTEADAQSAVPLVKAALNAALAEFLKMREAEGFALATDIDGRLSSLGGIIKRIQAAAGSVLEYHRKALHQRLVEAGLAVDLADERLVKELVLYSDRCDISEEITRANSHLVQFQNYLKSDEPVGRPLDFLTQELFRELNTMGSKANNAGLAHLVVEGKTEIEKIREQIQNIE